MATQQLDLVVYRQGRKFESMRVTADPDDSSTIRQHLLQVMKQHRNDAENQVGDYAVEVFRAGRGMPEYTYRTTPHGK